MSTSAVGMQMISDGHFKVQNMDFAAVAAGYAHVFAKLCLFDFTGTYNITGGGAEHIFVGPGAQVTALSGIPSR